ncbi:MAG: ferrous iron transport protein B [Rikenellaceae bacterium]|jgi:ferrous iron transport protein B|nr:ferrous iron transport protein B [Rikenellaceae bacterium]
MDNQIITKRLSDLRTAERGVITKVYGHGSFRKRIIEMGFVRGKCVTVIKNAPFQDPVEYEIMGYHIALRRSEAQLIEVSVSDAPAAACRMEANRTFEDESANRFLHQAGHVINVALVGNPNSGKTSLFNSASGSRERVGNYGGVTVDAKTATMRRNGYTIHLVDLPGTYSLTEYSPEELYVREHILQKMPDVVINVVDASNLERNLYLTTQLIDMDMKVVIALNMYDELEQADAQFDYPLLGQMIGIPIVPTVAAKEQGIDTLFDTVIDVFEDNEPTVRHIHINYGEDVERSIGLLQDMIWQNSDVVARYSSRYLAIKLLEGDRATVNVSKECKNYFEIEEAARREASRIEKAYGERVETVITDAKYGFIAGALQETYAGDPTLKNQRASRIDRVLTNRWLGIPIFIAILWLMFQTTFTLGGYPMEWIESLFAGLGNVISTAMPDGTLKELIVDGIIGGVGGVIVFLPNILILFLFISFMEDTGYMARAAFIMDRAMHKIGLHGKSFIPLLMGFGCGVPAIMATRTLESRKDRILTMMIVPFMSCSARLPVYTLLIAAFFPTNQGLILLSIYAIGTLIGILSSVVLKNLFFRKEEAPFVMELPPYRWPTVKSVARHTWGKGVQYLKKMGSVILIASVIVWALMTYPKQPEIIPNDPALHASVAQADLPSEEQQAAEQQEQSYIGQLGHLIEPAIRPLGFDWRIGVSLLSGFAAKEIVVSTMAVLTGAGEDEASLTENLQGQTYTSGPKAGEKVFTPLVAYTMMIFILLYFPCAAAIAAIRKEAGWRWALFSVLYTTSLAWILSFLVYQIGSRFV